MVQPQVSSAWKLKDFLAKPEQTLVDYPRKKSVAAKRILVVGLGEIDTEKDMDISMESLRQAGGVIAKEGAKVRAKDIVVCLPDLTLAEEKDIAQAICEGVILGDYQFDKYKTTSKKKDEHTGFSRVRFSPCRSAREARKGIKIGYNSAISVYSARDMAHEPGNKWTSQEFAQYAEKIAKTHGLEYTCLEKKEMEKLGMGGILAVNKGSAIPPRLVILQHKASSKKAQTLLLVGKGLTFDSGGISIKPSSGMEEMKYDMCGGAAVLSAMETVGQEKPDLNVIAIVPATDNMSGSNATRPGDIIRHYNAEGRLVLADALAYGIKTYKPDCVVDIATLTGAVVIGLGHHYTGLVSNNDIFSQRIDKAGKKAGEPLWRLPLTKDYVKQISSKVADMKNVGDRAAGTITAAAYLSKFVGDTPWVHLDIAGTAWEFTKKSYIPEGPS
ncbi:MAG: peptidase M17, partial [Desulfobacterales bacterium]